MNFATVLAIIAIVPFIKGFLGIIPTGVTDKFFDINISCGQHPQMSQISNFSKSIENKFALLIDFKTKKKNNGKINFMGRNPNN